MSRVIYLGSPTPKEKEHYQLLLKTQEETLQQVKLQKPFPHLMNFAKEQLGRHSSHFIHNLGHGVGIEIHEAPSFSEKRNKVQDNYVFTIEPGIYFPGKYGLRIEDTLLYSGQTKLLTKSPKELITLKSF